MEISRVYGSILVFRFYLLLLFFYGNDFIVAVAATVAVAVYFECVDFVVSAACVVYTLFVDCVPTVVETVVVVVVVVDVVAVVDLR